MSIQQEFAEKITSIVQQDPSVIGLAVAGSWLSEEIDEFSDLDLILVTKEKVSDDKQKMLAYARSFGDLLSGFTGEHVGERRVLICLYDNPLLHVDIKFLTPDEFSTRIETPVILADTDGQLQRSLDASQARFPYPEYQWIEDRFWVWVHYIAGKIGRGEYVEAFDAFGLLRMMVFGPLLHIKNNNLPRGVRKVETQLPAADMEGLKGTIPLYEKKSLIAALENSISLYKKLQEKLYDENVVLQSATEKRSLEYLQEIKTGK